MNGEERAAKRLREDEETALVLADLQARLEASEERADEAEAKAEALKTEARWNSKRLHESLARAQKRDFQDIRGFVEYHHILGRRGGRDGGRHRGDHQRAGRDESSTQA